MAAMSSLYLLSSNAVTLRRDKSILFSRSTFIILLYSLFVSITNYFSDSIERGIGLYGGLFQCTPNSQVFHFFILFVSSFIILLTGFFPRKVLVSKYYSYLRKIISFEFVYLKNIIMNKMGEQFRIIEYPLILLFVLIGACFFMSTGDVVSLFLSIELQSYGLYIISTIYRNSESATSGGLTYFLLGGLSSCFILFSTGLIYSNSGITHLDGLYVINNLSNVNDMHLLDLYNSTYIMISLVLISVGFLFKVSAAPFHFWSPDVYDAIPTVVTTFVALVAKISIFIFLLELVYYTTILSISKLNWTYTLLLSSLMSLVIGTVLGLSQFRIKRLFAYSTISHVGFILLSLAVNSVESVQAFIFYLTQYTISNLNVFFILIAIGYWLYNYIINDANNNNDNKLLEISNSPIQFISQIKGYFYINPLLALSFSITIFSLIGIPPLIGFFGKQMVLSSALDKGYVFLCLIGILTSVIGAAYYLNLVRQLFFDKTEYNMQLKDSAFVIYTKYENVLEENVQQTRNVYVSSCLTFTISFLTLVILLFILIPNEWLSIANILAITLYNT